MSGAEVLRVTRGMVRRRYGTVPNMLFALHAFLTYFVGWWSYSLARPADTFSTGTAYARFAQIMPDENYWAAGFGFAAVVGMVGCWAAWPGNPRLLSWERGGYRVCSSAFLGATHGAIALLSYQGNPNGTGFGVYAGVAVLSLLVMLIEIERAE